MPMEKLTFEALIQKIEQDRYPCELNLSRQELDEEQVLGLVNALIKNTSIETLNLDGIPLSERCVKALANLLSNRKLVALSLQNTGINSLGVEALANALATNKFLCFLNLAQNQLDDTAGKLLAPVFQTNATLQIIYINHNRMSENTGKLLVQALNKNITLLEFDISNNDMSVHFSQKINGSLERNQKYVKIGNRYLLNYRSQLFSEKVLPFEEVDPYSRQPTPNEILLIAVATGDIHLIDTAIQQYRANPDERGFQDYSPVLIAAACGQHKVIQHFKNQYPNRVNLRPENANGESIILVAAAFGRIETLEYLEAQGENLRQQRNKSGYSILLVAAANGRNGVIQYLLGKGISPQETDPEGNNAFLVAAKHGQIATLQFLLRKQPNIPPIRNPQGLNAFLIAAKYGQVQAMEFLIGEGADPLQDNGFLGSAASGEIKTLEFYLQKNFFSEKTKQEFLNKALLIAAVHGQNKVIEFLLLNGAQLGSRDANGCSPLLLAAANDHTATVEFLQTKGMNLKEERDTFGNTAILLATLHNKRKMVDFLLEHHPERLSERNKDGCTPLLVAAGEGHTQLLVYLTTLGSDLAKEKDKHGRTAILVAVQHGQLETIESLRTRHHINLLGEVDATRNSALHIAACNMQLAVVRVLLTLGGFIDQPNQANHTPLQALREAQGEKMSNLSLLLSAALEVLKIAKENTYDSIEALLPILLEAVNARDFQEGNTALHWAVLKENKILIATLLEKAHADINIPNKDNPNPQTAFELAIEQQDIYIKALFWLRKLKDLLAERKKENDRKEVKEKAEMNAASAFLKGKVEPLIKLLQEATLILQAEEKQHILFQLGMFVANPQEVIFNPTLAYTLLIQISGINSPRYKKANATIFALLDKHIVLAPKDPPEIGLEESEDLLPVSIQDYEAEPLSQEARVNRNLKLKPIQLHHKIKHLLSADIQDGGLLKRLSAEYCEREKVEEFINFDNLEVTSFLALIDTFRKMTITNTDKISQLRAKTIALKTQLATSASTSSSVSVPPPIVFSAAAADQPIHQDPPAQDQNPSDPAELVDADDPLSEFSTISL